MNWDRIEGNWKQAKGALLQQWGRMTNNYIRMIDGRRVKQLGEIQTSYGIARDRARHQATAWKKTNHRLTAVKPDSSLPECESDRQTGRTFKNAKQGMRSQPWKGN